MEVAGGSERAVGQVKLPKLQAQSLRSGGESWVAGMFAGDLTPIHEELIRQAAQARLMHNDDTLM